MKNFLPASFSVTSFAIFVIGLYFLADIELFLAVGFGVLLLIHELGHVCALKKLGRATNGVYFLPFIGAFVTTKEELSIENEYAYLKYLGPLMGTLGVLIAFLLFFFLNDQRFISLVFVGAILNLINMIPITFLDGHGMLRGVVKHVKWAGFLIAIIAGFFIFHEYMITLFLLVIFLLFVDESTEKATGYQLHEVILAGIFISAMIFLTITQGELLVWNIPLTALSVFLFGAYIKQTRFDKKEERAESEILPLTKKEKVSWGTRWLLLTTILLAIAFYANYLMNNISYITPNL